MIQLSREGKARIGVSNYDIFHLEELLQNFDVVPSINQVEFHPFLYQEELLQFCKNNNIQLEAYSPLTRGRRLNHPTVVRLAKEYGKTSAQILIRWSLQQSLVVIPKSIHENRIRKNAQVFDFQLEEKDMKSLNSLNEDLHTVFM
jgi:methylglyoxal/glyoxal reductase